VKDSVFGGGGSRAVRLKGRKARKEQEVGPLHCQFIQERAITWSRISFWVGEEAAMLVGRGPVVREDDRVLGGAMYVLRDAVIKSKTITQFMKNTSLRKGGGER